MCVCHTDLQVHTVIEESSAAGLAGDLTQALEKAKEAVSQRVRLFVQLFWTDEAVILRGRREFLFKPVLAVSIFTAEDLPPIDYLTANSSDRLFVVYLPVPHVVARGNIT